MSRPAGVFKSDNHAKEIWGDAYDAIPKSVFATVAWHLANLASGKADVSGAAEEMFIQELAALTRSGIIPKSQTGRVLSALDEALT
jgi:hypothetical protein